MSRERKGGLAALLHQGNEEQATTIAPQTIQEPKAGAAKSLNSSNSFSKAEEQEEEEQITIRAPKRYLKIIDRYRLTMITRTGNVNFSKKDAFTGIMKYFEENPPFELLQLSEEG